MKRRWRFASAEEEREIETLRSEGLRLSASDPGKAAHLLLEIVRRYEDTHMVANAIAGEALNCAIDGAEWDVAIEVCQRMRKRKHSYAQYFFDEERACRLDKQGQHIQALELRFSRGVGSLQPADAGEYAAHASGLCHYGDRFADIGAHDRAWRLYSDALESAWQARPRQTHLIRLSQLKLLLKEDKPQNGVEMMLLAINESQMLNRNVPKTLVTGLRKALRASGFNLRKKENRGLVEELVSISSRRSGDKRAVQLFHDRLKELQV